jgi:ribonuclease HI
LKQVVIYTDGACSGNPGPGGYGVVLLYQGHRKELSGGFQNTTNNRMEMLAAIKGLEALKGKCQVTIYSDSRYLVDSITQGWAVRWREKGWMRNKKETARNVDLWERLLKLCEFHHVEFQWVGHSGNEENERCHYLAVSASRWTDLPVDREGGKITSPEEVMKLN